jgi:hypothetical protein
MRNSAALALLIVAVLAACDGYSSGPDEGEGSLTGTHSGTVEGTAGGDPFTLTVTFTLTEYRNGVTGTYTTSDGTGGTVTGTISGSTVSFTINQGTPCVGTFTGTASISNGSDRLTGTYSGSSPCTGAVSASFVTNRT